MLSKVTGCLLMFLLFACDEPTATTTPSAANIEKPTAVERPLLRSPRIVMAAYFQCLKNRNHQKIKEDLLQFPAHQFFLEEPVPITDWEILQIAELSAQEADSFNLKPNPITGDYLLDLELFTVDEYKKIGRLVQYILRENKGTYKLVNRMEAEENSNLFLKYGTSLEYKPYRILRETDDYYLLALSSKKIISIDYSTQVIDELLLPDEDYQLVNRQILLNQSPFANWSDDGLFELLSQDSIAIDSLSK